MKKKLSRRASLGQCESGDKRGRCKANAVAEAETAGGVVIAVCAKHNTTPAMSYFHEDFITVIPYKKPT